MDYTRLSRLPASSVRRPLNVVCSIVLMMLAGCGTEAVAPKWGVGGVLSFDSYSLDSSGFWKLQPDSVVSYRLTSVTGAVDGRTNVHIYVSSADTIFLARLGGGDFEVLYPRMAADMMAMPNAWVPLPVGTRRDTTFMRIDSTVNFLGNVIRFTGDARSRYSGPATQTIPSGRLFQSEGCDLRGDVAGTLGIGRLDIEIRGSTFIQTTEAIVVRSDNEMVFTNPITPPMRFGRSLRLRDMVYPL